MKKTALFCAQGFEECEGLIVVDLLRRAGIEITTVSLEPTLEVTSSHQVTVRCDKTFDQIQFEKLDMIILPGGLPGTTHLLEHAPLLNQIKEFDQQKKYLAAICAAPSVYGELGLLQGRKMTCFPGFESHCQGAQPTGEKVVQDGHIITAKGLGAAIEFAARIIEVLTDQATADKVLAAIQY